MEYKYWNQLDYPEIPYGDGTVASSGCGLCSAIMVAEQGFEGGDLAFRFLGENDPQRNLMECKAHMQVETEHSAAVTLPFEFYFGPNLYKELKSHDRSFEKIIPMGRNIVAFINRFAIIPMFDFFSRFIGNFGIIILILALLVRVIIFPLTYKSYLSTAKMRVIKPEIDALNAKYSPLPIIDLGISMYPEDANNRQDLISDYYNAFNFAGTGMVRQTAITSYTNGSCVPGNTSCNYRFQYCYSLEYVNVPRLQTMGTGWFTKCYALTSVDFTAMTRIGTACFEECTALVSIRLPSCTQLLSKAFQKCYALTDVYLGYNGVCSADASDVFVNVPNKVKIHIPSGLKSSYESATNWSTFVNNDTVEFIEGYA